MLREQSYCWKWGRAGMLPHMRKQKLMSQRDTTTDPRPGHSLLLPTDLLLVPALGWWIHSTKESGWSVCWGPPPRAQVRADLDLEKWTEYGVQPQWWVLGGTLTLRNFCPRHRAAGGGVMLIFPPTHNLLVKNDMGPGGSRRHAGPGTPDNPNFSWVENGPCLS